MNKKINVKDMIISILEQEGEDKGIALIRNILNNIAKGKREKQIRVNTFDSIALEIYLLMEKEDYNRARAIYKIEEDKNIAFSTINNHLNTFNKKAKEVDYMNFGYWAESYAYNHYSGFGEFMDYIVECGLKFDITATESKAYYLKYKIDTQKKGVKFDYDPNSKYYPF